MSGKQAEFLYAVAQLLIWVNEHHGPDNGYIVTAGDLYRDPRLHGVVGEHKGYGSANSCHKLRLAIDLNCIKEGKLTGEFYPAMHDYWDVLGGAPRIKADMNHFSFAHNGYR